MTTPGTALAYAEGGALVVPLHVPDVSMPGGCSCRGRDCGDSAGKHGRTMHGHLDATSDPDTIRRWWGMWPCSNIGLRPRVDEVVVDLDPRNGGIDFFAGWQQKNGRLPPTRRARTGGGGWHAWYRIPPGLEVIGKLGPGLDIKSHAGLVVAPPSRHLSGANYEWIDDGPIAAAPEALLRAITRQPMPRGSSTGQGRGTAAQAAGLARVVANAQPGGRNDALMWACCRAAERGIDLAPLVAAAINNGLTVREAERTARSALRTIGAAA